MPIAEEVAYEIKLNDERLKADLKKSKNKLEKFTDDGRGQSGTFKRVWEHALGVFSGQALLQALNGATRAISSFTSSSINSAKVQEAAVHSMNTQLALAGDYSQAASRDIQNFASELQDLTAVGDETTLQMFALAKTFGRSNEETKKMVTAATELSAATGLSLEGSIKNLGKTFAGLTGELGESIPALRELTPEALKSGVAVDLLISKFGGSAEARLQTFAGQSEALTGHFGDMTEEFGKVITQNPVMIKLMETLGGLFKTFGGYVKDNNTGMKQFVGEGFVALIKAAQVTTDVFDVLYRAISGTIQVIMASIATLISGFVQLGSIVGLVDKDLANIFDDDMMARWKDAGKTLTETTDFANKLNKVLYDMEDAANAGLGAIAENGGKAKEVTDQLDETNRKSIEDNKQSLMERLADENKYWVEKLTASQEGIAAFSGLQKSKSKELRVIGKAGAISEAIINTYLAANKAYASLASIPPLAAAAAGAAIVIGLENVARIKATPVQKGIDIVPGIGFQDNFPAILAPGERVVPGETNKDLRDFLRREGGAQRASAPVNPVQVEISLSGDDIVDYIEAKFIDRGRFQTGLGYA